MSFKIIFIAMYENKFKDTYERPENIFQGV